MKKLISCILVLFLFIPFNVDAFDTTAKDCNLNDVATSGYTFDQIQCTNLMITSRDNLDFFQSQTTTFNKVMLTDTSFYDMRFLENSTITTLSIVDASVDFRTYFGNALNIDMVRGTVLYSDFSGLKRNKRNFSTVKFYNSYADDFSTLPVEMITDSVVIDKNKGALPDFDVFKNYKGNSLTIKGVGYALNSDVVEALNLNGVVVDGVDTSSIESDRELFDDIIDDLDFTNIDDIPEFVALAVTEQINNSTLISTDALHNYVNGRGDSYVYSIMAALYFKSFDIAAYTVEIEHMYPDGSDIGYYYATTYFDGDDWKYIDTYYLDRFGGIENVKQGLGSPYLSFKIGEGDVGRNYNNEEAFPDFITVPEYVIFQEEENKFDIVLYSDLDTDRLPFPIKEGYNFWGWYFDKNYTSRVTSPADLTPGDIVYAQWGIGNPPTNTDDPTDINPPTNTDDPTDINPPTNTDDTNEEKNPNLIKPPPTGAFVLPFILILSIIFFVIVNINGRKFKRIFRI